MESRTFISPAELGRQDHADSRRIGAITRNELLGMDA